MTLSKLEKYLSVLEVLVSRPLEFESILYQVDEQSAVLRRHLDFLVSCYLIERLPLGTKVVVYTITEKGLSLLRALQGQEYIDDQQNFLLVYED